jgi:hypothetical protein
VQALKRHRDIYFADRSNVTPASIIITTLAGRAYSRSGDLFDALVSITDAMPGFVEIRNGVHWIANPVQPQENFADRWAGRPDRAAAFFEWAEAARRDFSSIGDDVGIDGVLMRIAESFGDDAARGAGSALGLDYRAARDRGDLKLAPVTGALAVGPSGIGVRRHTFHGESA